ncbi:MAG: Gfo/Idh/MocA family oxidoreductase [Verrucomicrobia bacterium]|nr:Gfo/Idh/MocA family oxidoreductase [Verrucomicrobiota bacterium]MCF7707734.1 Gfo/Idh/MocA family oxidoreductase [Verrucomicrobiota bacterium]
MKQSKEEKMNVTRRSFIKNSTMAAAAATAATQFPHVITTHAAPDSKIRVGLIGCGGRGTGAALNVQDADENVEIFAVADLFEDKAKAGAEKFNIPAERCFSGWDAYKKVMAIDDISYVILATPPHFRPIQLPAAIDAGKNVFMEKPVAVDGPGIRKIIAAGEAAKKKGLGIVAGTQRRHQANYIEAIKRIQDGEIGDILETRAYWNQGGLWHRGRGEDWTDMEYQLRNWLYFTWISGDHIVEQHVHNVDVCNWVKGTHPIRAYGMGGRQVRTEQKYGMIYDHFAVEYEYPDGTRMFSQCRQIDGCSNSVSEAAVGTKGVSNCCSYIEVKGGDTWRYRGRFTNPYVQEHADLIASIRSGEPLNEARRVAESTMTAIMGRESCYSGQRLTWEDAINSEMKLGPDKYEFGPLKTAPVPMPGKHKFA